MTELLEFENSSDITREEAARHLRMIADQLERHNQLEFTRDGRRYTVDVASNVRFEVELEVGDDGSELEIEIHW